MKKSDTPPAAVKEEEEKSTKSMIFQDLKRVSYNKIDPRGALAFRVVFAFVAVYEALDFISTPELMIDEGYVSREEHLHIYSQRYRDISILNAAGTPFACGLMIGAYMSRSWYGEQRQETLSWTRRSSWCTQSVGKILVSASRMAFRRAWWISDTSSVCVRSVHSLTHSLSHSL